jgi:hypothetical protein
MLLSSAKARSVMNIMNSPAFESIACVLNYKPTTTPDCLLPAAFRPDAPSPRPHAPPYNNPLMLR